MHIGNNVAVKEEENMDSGIQLNNGIIMPRIGLGTWQIEDGDDVYRAVSTALNEGYRLIDTASIYGNEAGVGRAITESSVPREEIFLTTKLWNSDQGADAALTGFETSLEKLGQNYVDLYLIHWPTPKRGKFIETWKVFENLLADSKVRAIGVSNFKPHHLEELLKAADVAPSVNQIELHPRLQQRETREFCHDHDIRVESYSPIMQAGEIFQNETLLEIAKQYDKSVSQVVIRWHLQHGLIPIPKSNSTDHIAENFDVFNFTLSDEHMTMIDTLSDGTRINADPDNFN